ncbi:alpha/beta hydrolase [Litorilituus lipolyticus]|uniref:Alpha/beta fold hydrolase n=1 Tax=Litorilituus lipolyticus TaxID=2491017 RepID=A0A502KP53_9GAMM|nr:alpha/beta fold hydrolase [Litorilituus lipolyticus]TPH13382.1 alpha/beta fold hydrolase [Litorilituus lipolyticus]
MNKLLNFLFMTSLVLTTGNAIANEPLIGSWQGNLAVSPTQSIALIFHFTQESDKLKATLDVPIQHQYGLAFNKSTLESDQLSLALDAANIQYQAKIIDGELIGTYSQGGFKAPLKLKPTTTVSKRKKKVQEVTDIAPYTIEQVSFPNTVDGHTLSGTFTSPKGAVKAIAILLSGSGPTTRDADVFGHKVFAVLADQLTRKGIAVLRFDDRGVGKSTGDFATATSADFATDANAAYQFLATQVRFKHSKIGFIGHSEGGLIGAIAAANNQKIDFFVSLAGPGTSGGQILIDQSYAVQKIRGLDSKKLQESDKVQRQIIHAIENGISSDELVTLMTSLNISQAQAETQSKQMTSPWFEFFINTNPKQYFKKLTMPVLALNGALDLQVIAKQNIDGITKAVDPLLLTSKIYPQLNHLFQPAISGLPEEYSKIDITFSEQVSADISQWIKALN